MRKIPFKGVLYVALFFLFFSCSEEPLQNNNSQSVYYEIDLSLSQQTDWQMANEIQTIINQHRASIGLDAMAIDHQHASAYAVSHTKYMIASNSINHDNFNDRSAGLINEGASFVAENVAQGYSDAETVVGAWLNSTEHRENIEGNFTHAGFGILQNEQGIYFYTMIMYR